MTSINQYFPQTYDVDYYGQLEQKAIHPLIITGSFIFDFLSIHPFQDGNGGLSRLLKTHCLLQNDYSIIQYISFENHIAQNKKAYYEALMTGQKNRGTDNERIDLWLIFFLESLKTLTEKLEQKNNVFKSKGVYLNDRQRLIKDFITNNQPLKVSDLAKQFLQIGLSTLKPTYIPGSTRITRNLFEPQSQEDTKGHNANPS